MNVHVLLMLCVWLGALKRSNCISLRRVHLHTQVPKLHVVDGWVQAMFMAAAIGGPLVFAYMYRIGAWCTPYRYLWHFCCGCLVAVGGVLNSHV